MRRGTERAGRWQLTLALGLLVIGAAAAHAQSMADHLAQCKDEKGTAAARISACTRAITQTDNDDLKGEALLQRGVLHESDGDKEAAFNDYTEAIKLDPNNALAYFNRGNAYDQLGEHDLAIADYTEAIKLDPKIPMSSTTAARPTITRANTTWRSPTTRRRSGSTSENARDVLQPRPGATPTRARLHEAVADFDQAIKLDPERCRCSTWRARPPTRSSATRAAARADYRRVLEREPDHEDAPKASIASAISSRNDKKDRPEQCFRPLEPDAPEDRSGCAVLTSCRTVSSRRAGALGLL